MSISDARRYRYGSEKMRMAVRYCASAPGDARARLAGIYTELVVLREENLPAEAWVCVAEARARLEAGGHTVEENANRMRNTTAARLLQGLWNAYEMVERAYKAETEG